jgi:hypothetical protein
MAIAIEHKWIVVGTDMDGITGYQCVSTLDEKELRSGSYWGGITEGLSMSRKEMQVLADKLNTNNTPAPENPYRGIQFN